MCVFCLFYLVQVIFEFKVRIFFEICEERKCEEQKFEEPHEGSGKSEGGAFESSTPSTLQPQVECEYPKPSKSFDWRRPAWDFEVLEIRKLTHSKSERCPTLDWKLSSGKPF